MAHPIIIEKVRIRDFGCVKNTELRPTPLHALIGPNDSGKSTICRAVRTAMQLLNGHFTGSRNDLRAKTDCRPFHPGFLTSAEIEVSLKDYLQYAVSISNLEEISETISLQSGVKNTHERTMWDEANGTNPFLAFRHKLTKAESREANLPDNFGPKHPDWAMPSKRNRFISLMKKKDAESESVALKDQKPRMVRIDPDSLRTPTGFITSSRHIDMESEKGFGLASIYDALIKRNNEGFFSIQHTIKKLFPTISAISLDNAEVADGGIVPLLKAALKDGTEVPARFMSEGLLYYLAFAALQYLEPASVLFVEEPENGLHPSRMKDVVSILREVSKTTQVLIATHSPLVINELEPEEVTVVWRDEEKGTRVLPIRETVDFEKRFKVYALGELWLSYADGVDERPLRKGLA